jgi:hypothetical protein
MTHVVPSRMNISTLLSRFRFLARSLSFVLSRSLVFARSLMPRCFALITDANDNSLVRRCGSACHGTKEGEEKKFPMQRHGIVFFLSSSLLPLPFFSHQRQG